MSTDFRQERQQAHALLDLLPPAKLEAVRSLLAVMLDADDDEELTDGDRAAIEAGLLSLKQSGAVPMEDILADFGLTQAEFDELSLEDDGVTKSPVSK